LDNKVSDIIDARCNNEVYPLTFGIGLCFLQTSQLQKLLLYLIGKILFTSRHWNLNTSFY